MVRTLAVVVLALALDSSFSAAAFAQTQTLGGALEPNGDVKGCYTPAMVSRLSCDFTSIPSYVCTSIPIAQIQKALNDHNAQCKAQQSRPAGNSSAGAATAAAPPLVFGAFSGSTKAPAPSAEELEAQLDKMQKAADALSTTAREAQPQNRNAASGASASQLLKDLEAAASPTNGSNSRVLEFRTAFPFLPSTNPNELVDLGPSSEFLKAISGQLQAAGSAWSFALDVTNIQNLRPGNERCVAVDLILDVTLQTPPAAAETHQFVPLHFEAPGGAVSGKALTAAQTRPGQPTRVEAADVRVAACTAADSTPPKAACTADYLQERDRLSDVASVLRRQRDAYWLGVRDLRLELDSLQTAEVRDASGVTAGLLAHLDTAGKLAETVLLFAAAPLAGTRAATLAVGKETLELGKAAWDALAKISGEEGNVTDLVLDVGSRLTRPLTDFNRQIERVRKWKFVTDNVDGVAGGDVRLKTEIENFWEMKAALLASADSLRGELGRAEEKLSAVSGKLEQIHTSLGRLPACDAPVLR